MYSNSLLHVDSALQTAHWPYSQEEIYANPALRKELQPRVFYYMRALAIKAEIMLVNFEQERNLNDLKTSYAIYQILIDEIQSIQTQYNSDFSKKKLQEEAYSYFETIIYILFELEKVTKDPFYKKQAFHYLEHSKAYLLAENLRLSSANNYGVPYHIIEKRKKHKTADRSCRTKDS